MSFADAQAVARRIAAAASALLGEPLWLRDYPAAVTGDLGRVVIGVARETLHRALAIVDDLGPSRTAVVEVMTPDGPALRGHQIHNSDDERDPSGGGRDTVAAAIAAAIGGRPAPWPLGLLDAGYGLLDAIGQRLGVPGGRWLLSTWGEWDARASGVSIDLAGGPHEWLDVISISSAASGVAIRIPAGRMGGAGTTRTITTLGGLVDALGGIVEDVRAAIDGRAMFRARPESIGSIARTLVDAIRSAQALRGTLRVDQRHGAGFPHAWPTATIDRVDDDGAHPYVGLAESPAGVAIRIVEPHGPYPTLDAVIADLPALLADVRIAAGRLRPDRLIEGRAYRVIAPIAAAGATIEPGTRLIYTGRQVTPRDDFTIYRFAAGDPDGSGLELVDYSDTDLAILRRLHELIVEADPA